MAGDPLKPSNNSARKAALMLWILGGLALLLGLGLLASGWMLPTLENDPEVHRRLVEMRQKLPFDPRILFLFYGAALAIYGVAAVTVGILIRTGSRVALTIGLVLAALVATIVGLAIIATLSIGDAGGVLLPIIALAAHVWLIKWLIDALRETPQIAVAFPVPQPYQAMQAYYLPPMPPAR